MKGKKVSLAELMGSTAAGGNGKLSLKQLPEILGEAMPDLPRNSVGRHRLVRALQNRFGKNFRSLPGVTDLVKEFDRETDMERRIAQISSVKLKDYLRGK